MALSRSRELLIGRLRRRRSREREGLFLAEGVRCASTVLRGDADVRFAVVSPSLQGTRDGVALLREITARGIESVQVSEAALGDVADTETPQGVLLICAQPSTTLPEVGLGPASRLLVLDAVQDPGNAGTLMRVAAAFALDAAVVLDGSADPWGAKTVRASAGAVMSLPLASCAAADLLSSLQAAQVPLLAATSSGEDIALCRSLPGWALVVGNEGAGVRPVLLAAAARHVAIPMPGDVDSLNVAVAGALALYALTRGE